MLYISKDEFESHCPVGIDAQSDIFDSLAMFFNMAYMDLTSFLLGHNLGMALPEMFDHGEAGVLAERTEYIHPLTMSEIETHVKAYVVNRGMYIAIPSLDLVLTSNGFGVVQTQDMAPAIPERVNRLRQECYNAADRALDALIKGLPGNELTCDKLYDGRAWQQLTRHLVWTAEDFQQYCKPDSPALNRTEMMQGMPVVTLIENKIRDAISGEQFEAFLDLMREGTASWTQTYAIQLAKAWLTAAYAAPDHRVVREDGMLLSFMDEHPEDFPKYYSSNQYAARHAESFQTKKTDGCFIFR